MFDTAGTLTTFEQATLALQEAAVTAAHLQAWVALAVGLIQAGIVGYGIRYMARMGDRREQQHAERHAETMEAMRTQAERHAEATRTHAERHAETMEAMRTQAERHAETMRIHAERHAETMEAMRTHAERHAEATLAHAERHAETMLALRTLIERTAPPKGAA